MFQSSTSAEVCAANCVAVHCNSMSRAPPCHGPGSGDIRVMLRPFLLLGLCLQAVLGVDGQAWQQAAPVCSTSADCGPLGRCVEGMHCSYLSTATASGTAASRFKYIVVGGGAAGCAGENPWLNPVKSQPNPPTHGQQWAGRTQLGNFGTPLPAARTLDSLPVCTWSAWSC